MSIPSHRLLRYVQSKQIAEEMDETEQVNTTYCPHVGLLGTYLFTSASSGGGSDKSSSSATLSKSDSLSSSSLASCPSITAEPLTANSSVPIPLPPPASLQNGPSSTYPMEVEETKVNYHDMLNGFLEKGEGDYNITLKSEEEKLEIVGDVKVEDSTIFGNGVQAEAGIVVNGDLNTEVENQPIQDSGDTLVIKVPSPSPSKQSLTKGRKGTGLRIKRKRITCSECPASVNLWRCMSLDCGLVFCGVKGENHATTHFQENPDHAVQENMSSRRLWCNICNREVHRDYRNRRASPAIWVPKDNPDDYPPKGLYNIGNTCYMNAALQNIAAVSSLTSYFMGDTFHDDETRSRRVSGSFRMLLDELFGNLNTSYMSAVMPSRLLYSVRLAHPIFRGFHQHDSQEFLRLFMDTLSSETKVPHFSFEDIPISEQKENLDCGNESDTESFETADSGNGSEGSTTNGTNSQKPEDASSDEAMDTNESPSSFPQRKVKVTMKSILDDVFNGQIESSVQCLSCHETSRRLEVFEDLSLPIPTRDELTALHLRGEQYEQDEEEPVGWMQWFYDIFKSFIWGPSPSLYECLAAFFSSDELKGKNMYSCEKCKTLRNGMKRCSLYHLPEVLCVHLKRFRMLDPSTNANSIKINQTVKFPIDDLDVRPFLHPDCPDSVTSYRLMGIICHHGSVGMGHYTAYIRKGDAWYITDDCRVMEVSEQEVRQCEAYILFYQKWDIEQDENNTKKALLKTWADCDRNPELTLKFHLISRKWLTLYLWGEEDIPLDNSDVVCPHGRIVPVDNLEANATWVPDLVWNAIIKKCGGGPELIVQEFCQTCAVAWKKYQKSNAQQQRTTSSRTLSFGSMCGDASQFFSRISGSNESLSNTTATTTMFQDWQ